MSQLAIKELNQPNTYESNAQILVKEVESKKDFNSFIELPYKLFSHDKNWVPPLRQAVIDVLDEKKNPFFKYAKIKKWIAFLGEECVGRIAAIIDENHNNFHNEKTAFWGFFECINNQNVAQSLFKEVQNWAKANGMTVLRGPMNPSTNHECGLQISAFDTRPFIMMTQNPPYYVDLVEGFGFTKAMDLYAWLLNGKTTKFDDKLIERAKTLEQTSGIKVRPVNIKDFDNEVTKILEVYNDAWEKNWGFVPMNEEEFRHMAKEMKLILNPEMLLLMELNGEIIAFGLWLPDINQAIYDLRDGKLFPFGIFKLLWNLKVSKTKVTRGRLLTLGIKKKYQPMGLGALLYYHYLKRGVELGYYECECSWILENNIAMNKALQYMGAKFYKTYRIYDKNLT